MANLNAHDLELLLASKTLLDLPIDTKKIFFLIAKRISDIILSSDNRQLILSLYINSLCLHLSQTNNPKLSLFLAEKAIDIYQELNPIAHRTNHLSSIDALSITSEKIMIGNIQWSDNIYLISKASRMIAYILSIIVKPQYTDVHMNNICSLIVHPIWKYAQDHELDDLDILVKGLMPLYSNDMATVIRVATSVDKPTAILEALINDTLSLLKTR